jgi:hypothetical protein
MTAVLSTLLGLNMWTGHKLLLSYTRAGSVSVSSVCQEETASL